MKTLKTKYKMENKTIFQWFEELPEGELRSFLLEEMDNNTKEESLTKAIMGAFSWHKSSHGQLFWEGVSDFLGYGKMDYMKSIKADYLAGYNLAKETMEGKK